MDKRHRQRIRGRTHRICAELDDEKRYAAHGRRQAVDAYRLQERSNAPDYQNETSAPKADLGEFERHLLPSNTRTNCFHEKVELFPRGLVIEVGWVEVKIKRSELQRFPGYRSSS